MNEEQSLEILMGLIQPNNSLESIGGDMKWPSGYGTDSIEFEHCCLSLDQLEAIAWWMRNKQIKK